MFSVTYIFFLVNSKDQANCVMPGKTGKSAILTPGLKNYLSGLTALMVRLLISNSPLLEIISRMWFLVEWPPVEIISSQLSWKVALNWIPHVPDCCHVYNNKLDLNKFQFTFNTYLLLKWHTSKFFVYSSLSNIRPKYVCARYTLRTLHSTLILIWYERTFIGGKTIWRFHEIIC